MNKHNFLLSIVDTDSIAFSKPDMFPFSEQEQKQLLDEINGYMPELIRYEHDGYFKTVVVLKAKNYILYDGSKIKYKGSAIRDQKKEPALVEMLKKMIDSLLEISLIPLEDIYSSYIVESQNIKDIRRWATKKTVTAKVFSSERKNETKVKDAIGEKIVQEGDKIYVFPCVDGTIATTTPSGKEKIVPNKVLKLIEEWDMNEDKDHYLKRVYATVRILKNIVSIEKFPNYALKKNKEALQTLVNKI